MDKYEELLQIRDYLKFRLGLVSKNPYALLETLEKPLKLLDTRWMVDDISLIKMKNLILSLNNVFNFKNIA